MKKLILCLLLITAVAAYAGPPAPAPHTLYDPAAVAITGGTISVTSIDLGATSLFASRQATIDTGGGFDWNLGTASGDDFTIDTSALVIEGDTGNVGIGDSSPGTLLQLKGADAYLTLQNSTAENTDGGAETRIIFEDHANAALAQIQGSHDGAADDTKGDLIFYTHTGSALTEAMRIDSSQRLLVGHTASVAAGTLENFLQISDNDNLGGISILTYSNNAYTSSLTFGKSRHATIGSQTVVADNDPIGQIRFSPSDGTDLGTISAQISAEVDDAAPAASSIGGAIVLSTAIGAGADDLTEAMRIDSAQNVGIGSALDTWSFTALQVEEIGIYSEAPAGGSEAGITFNAYFDTGNSRWEYIFANEAAHLQLKNGAFVFQTAASGVADNAITWSTKMVLSNSNGNLNIGNATENGNLAGGLIIKNGTAASAAVTDGIQIFSVDDAGSTATLGLYLENAVDAEADETKFSHKLEVVINGATYYIMLTDS